MEKTNLILNSTIELIDVQEEGNGKGRPFVSRFIEPGIAHYKELGDILITKETLNKFINTMVGCPVIIEHEDVTDANADKLRVGVVSRVWFNEMDGYFYCEGILTDPEAIDLVKNQDYNVSCAYSFVSDNTKRTHNGKEIDMEFIDGEFLHLALVKDPRYERANIVVNKNDDDLEWITVKGNHIPVKKGQSKDEAVKEFLEDKQSDKLVKLKIADKPTKEAQEAIDKERERTQKIAEEHKKEYEKSKDIDLSKLKLDKKSESKDKSEDNKEKENKAKEELNLEIKKSKEDKWYTSEKNKEYAAIRQFAKYSKSFDEWYKNKDENQNQFDYMRESGLLEEIKKNNLSKKERNEINTIIEGRYTRKINEAKNSIGDITMQVLNDLKEFIKSVVTNEKEEEMKEVKNEDKRKLIDEVGGILKDKVDEELWRTVVGKLEKIAYEPSEDDEADNEDDKEKEAKNKCKNEEDEEPKEDVTKNEDKPEDDGEDKEEDKPEDKAENKKVKNSMRDMVMGGSSNVQEQKLYISRKERLEEGNKY